MKSKHKQNFQLWHCHWKYCIVSAISFKGSVYWKSLAPSKGWSPFGMSWIALDLWLTPRTISIPLSSVVCSQKIMTIPLLHGSFSEDHGRTPSSVVVHFLKIMAVPLLLWFIFWRSWPYPFFCGGSFSEDCDHTFHFLREHNDPHFFCGSFCPKSSSA